jgi:hypothetical protein
LPTLFVVAAGLGGTWVWAAGIPLFERVGAAGCAASAEPAIRLVASSAAANFVNIVFSCFCDAEDDSNQQSSAPTFTETHTLLALNAA